MANEHKVGTWAWAEQEQLEGRPCARYNRRCECVLTHTVVEERGRLYPESEEDLQATDWEHMRERTWDNASQRDIVRCFLMLVRCFRIIVDSRCAGVGLPPQLMGTREVCLELGANLPIPIPDLKLEPAGIRATLSFNKVHIDRRQGLPRDPTLEWPDQPHTVFEWRSQIE